MTAGQARTNRCTITQLAEARHNPGFVGVLSCLRYIRGILHEATLNMGMTETRLKNSRMETFPSFLIDDDSGFISNIKRTPYYSYLPTNHPYRLPKEVDYRSAVRTNLRKSILGSIRGYSDTLWSSGQAVCDQCCLEHHKSQWQGSCSFQTAQYYDSD